MNPKTEFNRSVQANIDGLKADSNFPSNGCAGCSPTKLLITVAPGGYLRRR